MATTFYHSCAGLCLLASLAACSRASYQFAQPAAYLPAVAAPPPPPATTLATPHQPMRSALALRPAPRPNRSAPPRLHLRQVLTEYQLPKRKEPLAVRRAPARAAAGSGPYFSGADFGAIIALLVLYALLIMALIGTAIFLLVKLILRFTQSRSRRAAAPRPAP